MYSDLATHSTPGAAVREAATRAARAAAQAARVDLDAVGDNVVALVACPKPWPDEAIRGIQEVLGHAVQVVGGTPASSSFFGGRLQPTEGCMRIWPALSRVRVGDFDGGTRPWMCNASGSAEVHAVRAADVDNGASEGFFPCSDLANAYDEASHRQAN